MRNQQSQPVRNRCTNRTPHVLGYCSALLTLLALSACSPGGVVAGTIGAAGAVAGTAVDVVLRGEDVPGVIE